MKKILYRTLFAVSALVFLVSAVMLVRYFIQSRQSQNLHNSLAGLHTTSATTAPVSTGSTGHIPTTQGTIPSSQGAIPSSQGSVPTDSQAPTVTVAPTTPPMLEEMQALYAINEHLVGWLTIPDTHVNYPVLQTPDSPDWRDYYLYRDFYGKDDDHGSLYVRESCDVFRPSDNVTIYGHNMADFTMFGDLWQYCSKNFYQSHKYIQFDTLYEHHTYEIIAVFQTSGTYGIGFAYHLFDNAADEAAFDAFVAKCKDLALYETGLTAQYGDKLLTLSTCDMHTYLENGRLVVVAKRIS